MRGAADFRRERFPQPPESIRNLKRRASTSSGHLFQTITTEFIKRVTLIGFNLGEPDKSLRFFGQKCSFCAFQCPILALWMNSVGPSPCHRLNSTQKSPAWRNPSSMEICLTGTPSRSLCLASTARCCRSQVPGGMPSDPITSLRKVLSLTFKEEDNADESKRHCLIKPEIARSLPSRDERNHQKPLSNHSFLPLFPS